MQDRQFGTKTLGTRHGAWTSHMGTPPATWTLDRIVGSSPGRSGCDNGRPLLCTHGKCKTVDYCTSCRRPRTPAGVSILRYLLYQDIVGITPANLQPHFGLLAFLTDAGERDRRNVPDDRLLGKFEDEVRKQR